MALSTLAKQVSIKTDGDVFFKIYKYKPHHICEMSSDYMKSVDLQNGEWDTVGSVVVWRYIHDGKENVAESVIEAFDDEKKYVCYKVTGGDLMEDFKTFLFSLNVDTKDEETVATWTFYYEKLNENVEDPESLLEFCVCVTKDIDKHHLNESN